MKASTPAKTKLYVEADKGRAICDHCGKVVPTTFKRRDVPFSDRQGVACGILVSVCDVCDAVVAIPAQSTPAIKEARRHALRPLEANLPAVYLDMLDLAAYSVDSGNTTEFRKTLVTLYLHRFASGQYARQALLDAHAEAQSRYPERRGATRRRLSMKVTSRAAADLQIVVEATGLNQTEVLKSVIFKVLSDVTAADKPALLRELGTLSILAA